MASSSDAMTARPPAWRASMGRFWDWWTGEIAQAASERFTALRGSAAVPLVAIEGAEVSLLEPAVPAGADASVDLAAFEEPRRRAAFRALLERVGETQQRVRLRLASGEALVRRVTMPLATEENLREVLGFEMDRLTPFRAEDVYFDYRVLSRDTAAGQLVAQVAVARRELVDARIAFLRSLDANVQAVVVREDSGPAPALDLLPSEQRGERESASQRRMQGALLAAVAVLLALALFVPIWKKRETVIALQPLVAKARQDAEATDRLARTLERQVSDYNFLLTRKYTTYPVLAYIEEVTRLLPDNTWVQQLDIRTSGKTREVQITGETTSSSKLIEILEQSKLLRNATPRGTVTRGSTPNSERFMIAAEAPPRALPEAAPIIPGASTAPAPAPPPAPAAAAPAPPPAKLKVAPK